MKDCSRIPARPIFVVAILLCALALGHSSSARSYVPRRPVPIIKPAPRLTTVVGDTNPNKAKALKPNLDLYVYRRCFAPNETVQINLSAFNAPVVQFAAYPLNLGTVVTSSTVMRDFGKMLKTINLRGVSPAARWQD